MGAGIVTNMVQVLLGALVYFIMVELIYRIINRESILEFIKRTLKDK